MVATISPREPPQVQAQLVDLVLEAFDSVGKISHARSTPGRGRIWT